MPGRHLKVIVTRKLPEPVEARMSELFDVELNADDTPMGPHANLKLIANYGAGFDHIDVQTALSRGIMVSNTPGVSADDTADVAMMLILAVPRRLREGTVKMQQGEWSGWAPTAMLGSRIGGKRLGILGMGRIGQAVARRAGGCALDQLPPYAGHLPFAQCASLEADEADRFCGQYLPW